ncbi:hypothetical protein AIOL_001327 [Candidatus Rhodobacter oscarellae]|uniref:Uncharacterized protein n=1 Tax=Candidatus Rhodobacter oscarellae TaxID=1675527 RepID=A0A0J9E0X2_9RHOB|nr:hypothetical protein [Candidatus Rhodobacter lobularis]KMW56375.1 hypothetical protein AIOL_001327 [Candidatus Rhodobacter lobularis]
MPIIRRPSSDDLVPARPQRVGAQPSIERRDIVELDADFFGDDLRHLQDTGISEPENGLPDPRRPLGMSAVIDESAASIERKTYDQMLRSLAVAQEFVAREGGSLPKELTGVAANVLEEEVLRTRIAADRALGLIEV